MPSFVPVARTAGQVNLEHHVGCAVNCEQRAASAGDVDDTGELSDGAVTDDNTRSTGATVLRSDAWGISREREGGGECGFNRETAVENTCSCVSTC